MDSPDFSPCPFCAHAKPIVVTIAGDPPAYVIACPECGATGPKQLPGVALETAVDAWNRRYGMTTDASALSSTAHCGRHSRPRERLPLAYVAGNPLFTSGRCR